MRYLINFQVLVTFADKSETILRSTYTLLEKELGDNDFKSFEDVKDWFDNFFNEMALDNFVNTTKLYKEVSKTELKIGRITDSLSGEYKTF